MVNYEELGKAMFGELTETEKVVVSLIPKVRKYCVQGTNYDTVLEILAGTIIGNPEMSRFLEVLIGLANAFYVLGIERGKKEMAMTAMLGGNEDEL